MKTSRTRWIRGMGTVVLVGGLLILGTGNEVTQAGERDLDHNQQNPFHQILDKLDQILAAIKGGEGQDGNPTLRWDTNHPSATRFITVFTGAVLDKNTGLVWEQAPNANPFPWFVAISYCVNKNVGGTRGWRLPSVTELVSLIDPSLPVPFVPVSVFPGVQPFRYWSASTDAGDPTRAWYVNFPDGLVLSNPKSDHPFHGWCVRGPMQESVY